MGDEQKINEITQRMGSLFESFGASPAAGKVMSLLYFKGPLTQEQLKEEMGCSLSAVSQAMTYLRCVGLIKAEKWGERKKKYSIEFSRERMKNSVDNFLFFGLSPMIDFLEEKEKDMENSGLRQKSKNMKKLCSGLKEKVLKMHLFG